MQRETVAAEKHHTIPFKSGTKFTVNCALKGSTAILCSEHAGPEKCVNGKPWILVSDLFAVIKGKVGQSITVGLSVTSVSCKK